MRLWRVLALVLALPALGQGELWLGEFPVYPGAVHRGSEHVNAQSSHIAWSAYSTVDSPEKVREFYRARFPRMPAGGAFSVQIGDKRLSVHTRHSSDFPKPPTALEPEDQTVIIVSQQIR